VGKTVAMGKQCCHATFAKLLRRHAMQVLPGRSAMQASCGNSGLFRALPAAESVLPS